MNGEHPDPHLRAALRHAPDAELQAPRELSARILAAARAAVAGDEPLQGWRRLLMLPPLRLGASGAFATLVLAGVVGLLWHAERPGPASERVDGAAAPAPAAAVPEAAPAAPPSTAPVAAAPAAAPRDLQAQRRRESASGTPRIARVAPPPGAAPAPAGTLQANTEPPAKLAERADAAARSFAKAAAPRSTPPPTWRVDGGAPGPLDSHWLDELQRVAGTRWQPASPVPAAPGTRRIEFGEGAALTQILLGPSQVLWCESGGMAMQCRSADLGADEASRLLALLPPR